jgi:hypothetical protein
VVAVEKQSADGQVSVSSPTGALGTLWAEGRPPNPTATEDDGVVVEDDAAAEAEGGAPDV